MRVNLTLTENLIIRYYDLTTMNVNEIVDIAVVLLLDIPRYMDDK